MSILENNDQLGDLLRHFSVVVNNGSGCIFQPSSSEYSYIFTVKHNLRENEEIKVSRTYEDFKSNIHVKVVNYFTHDKKDYAIIQTEKIENPEDFKIHIGNFVRNTEVIISGFPNYKRVDKNQSEFRTSLNAKVETTRKNPHEYDLTLDKSASTFNAGAGENVIGYSGSGIFYEEYPEIYLVGTFPKLDDAEATSNKVVGFDLSGFVEIIKRENLFDIRDLKPKLSIINVLRKKWKLISTFFLITGVTFLGYVIQNKPDCDVFTATSDINILINGKKENNINNNTMIDKVLNENLFPFNNYNNYLDGNASNSSSGELKTLSGNCGAHLLVSGTDQKCDFLFIDNKIYNYFQEQYALLDFSRIKLQSDIKKMTCLLKCYLFDKKDIKYVKKNFQVGQCVELTTKYMDTEKQDTIDQIILQSIAYNYERIGNKNEALNILVKINEGGLNPDTIYKRQERLSEEVKQYNNAIIAQTGLIKIAQQKNDKKAESEILERRAANYERTNQKTKALDDYKKIDKIEPGNKKIEDKIIKLDKPNFFVNVNKVNTSNAYTLISIIDQLIATKQFEKADLLLSKNPTIITNNSKLEGLKAEVDYNLHKIDANKISPKILQNNANLETQIRVDKIKNSKKVLLPKKDVN